MRYIDEYRTGGPARALARQIAGVVTRPWTLMEVCGGQTHAIVRFGIDRLLPSGIELLHGPGCPVCVTPVEAIDQAIEIASRPEVLFCSFGDMLRVPGSGRDLLAAKAGGADVRMVYSPLDAVRLAQAHPARQVVFFAVGFETTAPAYAMAVRQARALKLSNFTLLVSQVLVPPAMKAILAAPANRVQAFLAAGHVCTVMGLEEYRPLARRYRVPIVATGFEPLDILEGILMCVRQLEEGRAEVENQYARSVQERGNAAARSLMKEVFRVTARDWRGLGEIPSSGLELSEAYAAFDARRRFRPSVAQSSNPASCRSGEVLQGQLKPPQCAAFGVECTPEHPLGPTMVSGEGACAAYYHYRRTSATSPSIPAAPSP